jgi:hypothetical protein
MLELFGKNTQKHPFHLVDSALWSLVAAFAAFTLTSGAVLYMHNYIGVGYCLLAYPFLLN